MARLDREQYFELGLDLLAEGGAKAVTIESLCARLQVTKGSFYHHFDSGPDFMRQLLSYWESGYGHRLAETAATAESVRELIPMMKRLAAYELRHEAESAIRALAGSDPVAAEVQRRVDQRREDLLVATFVEAGMRAESARTLARIGIAILIGTQQRERPVDRDRLYAQLDEYQRWLEHTVLTDPAPRPATSGRRR